MKLTAPLALAALAGVAIAVPIESPVLARAKALYKRNQPALAASLAKRNNGGSSSGPSDTDILNFALNLEYLEAQYYHIAAYGSQLPQEILNGTGLRGYVADDAGSQVPFKSEVIRQLAIELATDEQNHVMDLRAALGGDAVAMPQLDLSNSFTAAAQAAGIVGMNDTFSPYTSDANFLAGAFLFEDVGVTAYNGAAPLISDKTILGAAASILAVEAYHAGAIRTLLVSAAQNDSSIFDIANKAAAAEGSLDDGKSDGIGNSTQAQFVNVPNNTSLAYARTPGQVLDIVYLSGSAGTTMGGFFPYGLNGNLKTAAGSGN